jgi:hypothetical protein
MPSSHSHEEFIALCALSTSGTLTSEELKQLEEHLLQCPSCREIKRQYESVVDQVLPVLATASTKNQEDHGISAPWSLEQAEALLMEKLDADRPAPANSPNTSPKGSGLNHLHTYLLAALLLICCDSVLYVVQHRWHHIKLLSPAQMTAVEPIHPAVAVNGPVSAAQDTGRYEREIAQLRAQLSRRAKEIDQLNAENSQSQKDLTARTGDLDSSAQQNAALEQQLASAHSDLAALQAKLNLAEKQGTQNASQVAALQNEVANLNVALQQGDREVAEDEGMLAHDRDIRDLIGARNLYIAEIYDVAKTGATKKPFGRVFYTKDKSLIFYGYDLDQQPGIKDTSTFQAWGRSGSSEHDISLGLFYRDDASKKRWILRCDDANTLARLDAVFVTVEPKGGSVKPTSKPLLFTYLRLEPNHP